MVDEVKAVFLQESYCRFKTYCASFWYYAWVITLDPRCIIDVYLGLVHGCGGIYGFEPEVPDVVVLPVKNEAEHKV